MSALLERLRENLEAVAEGAVTGIDFDRKEAADLLVELERTDEYEGWADLDLVGHRRRIGYVRPIEIARRGFLEITGTAHGREYRELWSPTAVFCITPLDDEDTAKRLQEAADRPQF